MSDIQTDFINLITRDGDTIEIEYPSESMDEFLEDMRNAMQQNSYWNCGNYPGCRAVFKGIKLEEINMNMIIGIN